MSTNNQFYLGRIYDPAAKKVTGTPLLYDPADLTTHAIITGMTGSGKTGLVIDILEEAALQKIPAIIIDPKGDLTNLLLHFPDAQPQDFEPWLDVEVARREGKALSVLAEETAKFWKKGQAEWGIDSAQIQKLKESVRYRIYTPGSTAGLPINVLSSFNAPAVSWEENREALREEITSNVSALLGLIGLRELDPLRSKEHILISNLIENAWSKGISFDLTELILQIQKPPFERLGAFPLNNFFPERERMELAMLLNNFLASPSFQSWMEGQTMDIPAFIYDTQNKPCHSIFYIAHLDNNERMFFVSLLMAAIESWMRAQRGTSGLRLLVAFDEIMGYLPATSNPPSRTIMLRMLKQARAFGVGLMLATQNPIDVDYKALSNAGSWFIGRLQTDQDKQRLMDGLRSAGGNINITEVDRLISSLGKRVFYLHNVHEPGPRLFGTRWTMNYLAGPITRSQLPELLKLHPESAAEPVSGAADKKLGDTSPLKTAAAVSTVSTRSNEYSQTRPEAPGLVNEYFLQYNLEIIPALKARGFEPLGSVQPESIVYTPALFALSRVYYYARKYNLEYNRPICFLVEEPPTGMIDWGEYIWESFNRSSIKPSPLPKPQYAPLPAWLMDEKKLKNYEAEIVEWIYRNGSISIFANELLKLYAAPDIPLSEFKKRCEAAAETTLANERKTIDAAYNKKLTALQNKIKLQEYEVQEQKDQLEQRRLEELGTHGELVLSLFSKRKRSLSSSLSKRRMTEKAKSQYQQEMQELEILEKELMNIEQERTQALQALEERWKGSANQIAEVPLPPLKKDIQLELYGIAWIPNYLVVIEGRQVILPAFTTRSSGS